MLNNIFNERVNPWSPLGVEGKDCKTVEEVLKKAHLDWPVQQRPLMFNGEETEYAMSVKVDEKESLLGVTGKNYKVVQNIEAFNFTDELIGEGLTYEKAGQIRGGKRIWMVAKLPEEQILDDLINPYVVLMNSHDSTGSLKVFITPVRIACSNALNLALKKASRSWNIRHSGDIGSKMSREIHARQTANETRLYMEELKSFAKEYSAIKIAPSKFEVFSSLLFPVTANDSERKEMSQELRRAELRHAWEMEDLGNHRGTGWGLINAVADMATHRKPSRETEDSATNLFTNTLEFPTLLDKATKLIKEVV